HPRALGHLVRREGEGEPFDEPGQARDEQGARGRVLVAMGLAPDPGGRSAAAMAVRPARDAHGLPRS
ncbi:MAG TPA: hypothetical protein VF625_12100, partial [Longimicrobium sp.]